MNLVLHPSDSRGAADFGWLKARYSFSFANYFNPKKTEFGKLRVLNDDLVKGGMGFGTHPHRDMEIISIPLKGSIKHKDSMDHSEIIKAGEVQVMSAGTGVEHSEFNPSQEELNLLQIWIFPDKNGLEPRYEQKDFSDKIKKNEFTKIVVPKEKSNNGALWINQEAYLSLGDFDSGITIEHYLENQSHGVYVFLIEGSLKIDGNKLKSRDAAGVTDTSSLTMEFEEFSRVLLIEVPMN